MEERTAKRVRFSGTVQGVGFRYTATGIARKYDVVGYVMNLPDGGVELLVEGPENDVLLMIEELKAEMAGYIRRTDVEDLAPSGKYHRFTIRYAD